MPDMELPCGNVLRMCRGHAAFSDLRSSISCLLRVPVVRGWQGEFQVRLQLVQPKTLAEDKTARIQFNVYLDEDWPGVESMDEVCSRTTKSKQVREIEAPAWLFSPPRREG